MGGGASEAEREGRVHGLPPRGSEGSKTVWRRGATGRSSDGGGGGGGEGGRAGGAVEPDGKAAGGSFAGVGRGQGPGRGERVERHGGLQRERGGGRGSGRPEVLGVLPVVVGAGGEGGAGEGGWRRGGVEPAGSGYSLP